MTERVRLPDVGDDGRAVLFDGEPKTVRLSLEEGDRVPPHRHPGRDIVCHVLEGALELDLGDETVEAESGDVLRFDGDQDISPYAMADSVALLVLAER